MKHRKTSKFIIFRRRSRSEQRKKRIKKHFNYRSKKIEIIIKEILRKSRNFKRTEKRRTSKFSKVFRVYFFFSVSGCREKQSKFNCK